jgi:hypothetical protein
MKIAGSGSVKGKDPRIRIHIKISWIRNTGKGNLRQVFYLSEPPPPYTVYENTINFIKRKYVEM